MGPLVDSFVIFKKGVRIAKGSYMIIANKPAEPRGESS